MQRLKLPLLIAVGFGISFLAGHGLARLILPKIEPLPKRLLEPVQVEPEPVQRYGFEGIAPRGGRVR